MKTKLTFALIAMFFSTTAITAQPTSKQIAHWLSKSGFVVHILDGKGVSDEKYSEHLKTKWEELRAIDPERPVYLFDSSKAVEVKLRNTEVAYLLEADGPGGRNASNRVLLLRPSTEQVCEIDNPKIKFVKTILDLDNDGVSEIVAERIDSGQGSNYGTRYLMQLDGCNPVVLRSVVFEDDEGAYGRENHRYFRKDAEWSFADIDGDGTLDLYELRIVEEGRNGRQPIVTKQLYKYVFKAQSIVRYVDHVRKRRSRN